MENFQLYCGDFFELSDNIEDESVNLAIFDPPYNVSKKRTFTRENCADIKLNFGEWDFFESEGDGDNTDLKFIRDFLIRMLRIVWTKLKDDAVFYCFLPDTYLSFCRYYWMYSLGGFYKQTFIWVKPNPAPKFMKNGFLNSVEYACVLQKKKRGFFNFLSQNECKNYMICPAPSGKERIKIFDEETEKMVTLHPTQKPEKLMTRFIRLSSRPKDLVWDGFMGTGTTIAVAKKLGRMGIGFELNEKYFSEAEKRINRTILLKKVDERDQSSISDFF